MANQPVKFTDGHYGRIAHVLKSTKPELDSNKTRVLERFDQWQDIVLDMCDMFKSLSHKFDEGKFLKACDYKDEYYVPYRKNSI